MGHSRRMIFFIIFLTTLFSGSCSESVPSNSLGNWRDAQMLCRENNTVLTNVLYSTSSTDRYYWTGYHIRMSQWIKIIGCFPDTVVNRISLDQMPFEMQFPSTGLCQEYCLQFNSALFGVKSTKCVCLEDEHLLGNVAPDQCRLLCNNTYSEETSIKFSHDCGGENTYNVFKTGFLEQANVIDTEKMECLAIQCTDKKFIPNGCGQYLNQVCDKSVVHEIARNWNMSSEFCKEQRNVYLFGDVPTPDVQKACEFIEGKATGPTWLGIAKEKYISMDRVSDQILPHLGTPLMTYLYVKRCLKCNNRYCIFADCAEQNMVACKQMQQKTTTATTTKASYTSFRTTMTINESYINTGDFFSTTDSSKSIILETTTFVIQSPNMNESLMNSKDDSVPIIPIALSVTVFITVGSVALILGIIWKRRQTEKNAKTKQTQHDTDSLKYSEKKNVDHSLPNNYFVLAKTYSDSCVDSTNLTTDKYGENPYKESSDGDYDHLGENFIQKVEEDTYHHAFFLSKEDESDYGVKNISEDKLTENPYDHTNTGAYQTTMPDNEYNTISFNP